MTLTKADLARAVSRKTTTPWRNPPISWTPSSCGIPRQPKILRITSLNTILKNPAVMYGSTFLGLVLMQNPADMWIMQEIITEIRPDFIIEIGTFAGGSAVYYATILNQVNNKGKVITVDIDPNPRMVNINKLKKEDDVLYNRVQEISDTYIEFITSNSVDPALIERLKEQTENKKVLITLDSCHSYEHVLNELILYSQLVSPGSWPIKAIFAMHVFICGVTTLYPSGGMMSIYACKRRLSLPLLLSTHRRWETTSSVFACRRHDYAIDTYRTGAGYPAPLLLAIDWKNMRCVTAQAVTRSLGMILVGVDG